MKIGKANQVFCFITILFGALILFETWREGLAFISKRSPGAGFFPIIIGIGIIICGVGMIWEQNVLRRKVKEGTQDEYLLEEAKTMEKPVFEQGEVKNFFIILGVALMVVLLSKVIGLITAVTLAMIAYIRFLGKEPWKLSLLIGVGTGVVMFMVFGVLLNVPMPKGPLGF